MIGAALAHCPLCGDDAARVLWRNERVRVIAADEPDYPGFSRVIWGAHVREMSQLDAPDREHLWQVVHVVETALRDILVPDKINLASLGNVVPHLHWHVIPRWHDDRTFPNPVWGHQRALPDPAERAVAWQERQARAQQFFVALPQLLGAKFPW